MQLSIPTRLSVPKVDRILVIALILGLAFGLYGINWGWVECWNPDQMAFKNLFTKENMPFSPPKFEKPPFHTYFNFFLSVVPIKGIGKIINLSPDLIRSATLLWSRTLTVFLFLGAIVLLFYITKRFFGLFAARLVAIVFSTSAGLIVQSHYLTADIPVLFWMLLAFYFAQNILLRGQVSDYVWSGFFTGISTATKYNGLAIGIVIVVAHALSFNSFSWKKIILSKKIFFGLVMVPIGFLVGNPFALLDYYNFISDFTYNYIVTPVYDGGASTEHGYWKFFLRLPEAIGFPAVVIFAIASLFSIYFISTAQKKNLQKKGVILLLSIFLIYYYKFGSFPRVPVRFVIPVVPFWVIISGPFWNKLKPNRIVVTGLLVFIVSYNLICSFYVGKRFAEDPRMQAQEWVSKNIPEGSLIESDTYTPNWNLISGVNLKDERMPYISGRGKLFEKLFPQDSWEMEEVRKRKKDETTALQWYSPEELLKRQPEYIAVDSLTYDRFFSREQLMLLYPDVRKFYMGLLNEQYPYKIVFDRASPTIPKWIYPPNIGFVDNRITILKKSTHG